MVAQVDPAAAANFAVVRAGTVTAPSVAPGTDVWSGLSRQANGTTGSAWLSVQHAASTTQITVAWQAGCQAVANGSCASDGSLRYRFDSPVPFVGQLAVGWSTTLTGTGASSLALDLHDDGSIDANGATTLPVAFGPAPLFVRVTTSASANAGTLSGPFGSSWSWWGSASTWLALQLTASPAIVSVEAAGCGNPAPGLTAQADLAQGIELRGACPPSVDLAILVLGFLPVPQLLPWSPFCTMHVAPVLTEWSWPDAQRSAVWSLPVPFAVRPVTMRTQMLGLAVAAFELTTSPALRIDLP